MRIITLVFLSAVLLAQSSTPTFTTVSSASFSGNTFAPESLVTGFGSNLATGTAVAGAGTPPTMLGGVSVMVIDSQTQSRPAGLLYVSPGQINFMLPSGLAFGAATTIVNSGSSTVAQSSFQIASVSPSLFAANSAGSGLAAARAVTVASDGTVSTQPLFDCTATAGRCVSVPVLPGSSRATYLELYGTGIRARSGLSAVQATAGGTALEVSYAGAQGQFAGLDQVNVRVPDSLATAGLVNLILTVDETASNSVSVQFGGRGIAPEVSVLFAPAAPDTGPFPTDFLTVPDASQQTGLRVNLPLPDCDVEKTTCETYRALNQLDGFNVQPRIAVRFTAAVDPNTLRNGIHIVWLDRLTTDEKGLQSTGHVVPINRIIFDPDTQTAYAKPDDAMDQNRRYALVVSDAVRDSLGNPLLPSQAFTSCVTQPADNYCRQLAAAQPIIEAASGGAKTIATSIFTTMSATSWMEAARASVQATDPAVKRTALVDLKQIASATLKLQTGSNPAGFETFDVPLPSVIAAGSGRVAFGSYTSVNFLNAQQTIATLPTNAPLPPSSANSIAFHVFLPSGQKPDAGYPVIIFGHGLSDSSFGAPTLVAGTFARHGFATLAINAVGHGSGPQTNLVLTDSSGPSTVLATPGRGIDINGDGKIDSSEGCLIPIGGIALRDCLRQTAVDLMQLVHAVRAGMDLDGDGKPDLDPQKVYYAGQSLGSLYGTIFMAVNPEVGAAVLNVGGASVVDIAMISDQLKPLAQGILALHSPPLLNAGESFNANPALQDQPAKVNTVPGAIAIQNYVELLEWLEATGDPQSFAPHLHRSPLSGMLEKKVLFQIARGDRTVPNPANSNLIRQAGGQDATVLYRHDIAKANSVGLADNPHAFLVDIRSIPGFAIAASSQGQIAGYLDSGGTNIPDANSTALDLLFLGHRVFERPAVLPEDLGF